MRRSPLKSRVSKLDIDKLRERWKAIYGKPPSREIGRSFLTRAIAHRLQERAYGGLKPSTQRLLAIVADRNRPLKHVQRAHIVLFSADRLAVPEVARRGLSNRGWATIRTAASWKRCCCGSNPAC